MMKSFQRFIALAIMNIATWTFFNRIVTVLSIQGIIETLKLIYINPDRNFDASLDRPYKSFVPNFPIISIIANIIMIALFIAMVRELYLMYKYGKDELQVKKENEVK